MKCFVMKYYTFVRKIWYFTQIVYTVTDLYQWYSIEIMHAKITQEGDYENKICKRS
jgi:hypothetical protein